MKFHLVLASGSPRRLQLLQEAGYDPEVIVPSDSAECGVCSTGGPAALVAELASRKAADVAERLPGPMKAESPVIIAADTVAECAGVCVWPLYLDSQQPEVRVAVTTLRMDQLSEDQLEDYLASGAWQGKAGGFGYQDRLGWVHVLQGSESNVVGLPMELLESMLADL